MVGAALGKEGFELLPDGLDEVRWECGHGACSFRSGSLENSPHDGASVPALHHDALPIDGSSKLRPVPSAALSLRGSITRRPRHPPRGPPSASLSTTDSVLLPRGTVGAQDGAVAKGGQRNRQPSALWATALLSRCGPPLGPPCIRLPWRPRPQPLPTPSWRVRRSP